MSASLFFRPERIDELHCPIREDLAAFRSHEIALHDRAVAPAPGGAYWSGRYEPGPASWITNVWIARLRALIWIPNSVNSSKTLVAIATSPSRIT